MPKKSMQQVDDFMTLAQTIAVDLPISGWQWLWGLSTEEAVTKVAWQGYDAGVRLAAAAIDDVYRLPLTATILKNAAPTFFRWRRVSNVVAGAVFASLWPTIGLPTAGEMQALREAVDQLSTDQRAQHQASEALVSRMTRIVQALEADTLPTAAPMHNGFELNSSVFSSPTARPAHSRGN